jgi:hypothetical protein
MALRVSSVGTIAISSRRKCLAISARTTYDQVAEVVEVKKLTLKIVVVLSKPKNFSGFQPPMMCDFR